MREIIALFTQSESRDELGIGQVRDAFSDSLFPGTSTLHTRARYFLFIPWCFRAAEQSRTPPERRPAKAAEYERSLIKTLLSVQDDDSDTEGLIGRRAGAALKNLPSTLYWGGLRRYGIALEAEPRDAFSRTAPTAADDADELTERHRGAWSPTLPAVPTGFPYSIDNGFALNAGEAQWLQERMVDTTGGSLLHHLLLCGDRPQLDSDFAWTDPITRHAPSEARDVLEHARLFSLVMEGISGVYNLLIAERYEKEGLTRIPEPIEHWRSQLDDWAESCDHERATLLGWDLDAFWSGVRRTNPRIGESTRRFLTACVDIARSSDLEALADDQPVRRLVAAREKSQKQGQSRLTNRKLLETWSGGSGAQRLDFRWARVRRIVADIHDGLGAVDAGT